MSLQGQSILSVSQFDRDSLSAIFKTTDKLTQVAQGKAIANILQGAVLANLFFEASTRTRMSFHSAFARLGGNICDTTGFSFSSISKGESLADTAKVISSYADVIVMRHPDKGAVAEFAEFTTVPVINGGDGPGEHPTQALLDMYTIVSEFAQCNKPLSGATIVLSGDLKHGRTVHSLAKLLSLFDSLRFKLVAPEMLAMPEEIVALLRTRGHEVNCFNDPYLGFQGGDVIYCTRIQKERFSEILLEGADNALYSVDQALLNATAKADSIILHPLPRDAREGAYDLTTDFDTDSRLKIFTQAANGVTVRMALFLHVLGMESRIGSEFTPAPWAKIKH